MANFPRPEEILKKFPMGGPPVPMFRTSIVENLNKSILEESKAVSDYTERAARARNLGDHETAKLYDHLMIEEQHHWGELHDRLDQLR